MLLPNESAIISIEDAKIIISGIHCLLDFKGYDLTAKQTNKLKDSGLYILYNRLKEFIDDFNHHINIINVNPDDILTQKDLDKFNGKY